jgi:hypothetical protein
MADDVRISVGLRRHRKTKRLKRLLGGEGCWALVCLFLWVGEERWTGDLSGLSDADIEEEADWDGEPGALIAALLEVGFLTDSVEFERAVHGWQEHNPYAANKGARIERSKKAAGARWWSPRPTDNPDARSMPQACPPHAGRINKQCPPSPSPAPTPTPTERQKPKPVQPTAARFADFWAVYPNKKGKQEAEKRWQKDKLDAIADQIIAHVGYMKANDDGWNRGYEPMGSTYLNQARWTDEARGAPMTAAQTPGKQLAGLMALEEMKHGMVPQRNHHGHTEARGLGFGAPAVGGSPAGYGGGLAGSAGQRLALGPSGGRPQDSRGVLDLGPDSYRLADATEDA